MRRGAFSGRGDDDEHGPTARKDTGAPHRNGRPRGGRSKPTAGTAAWDDGIWDDQPRPRGASTAATQFPWAPPPPSLSSLTQQPPRAPGTPPFF